MTKQTTIVVIGALKVKGVSSYIYIFFISGWKYNVYTLIYIWLVSFFNLNHSMGKYSRPQFDFFLSFSENTIWRFMQIVSVRDHLHEMWKHIFWKKLEKYLKISSTEFFSKHAKHERVTV